MKYAIADNSSTLPYTATDHESKRFSPIRRARMEQATASIEDAGWPTELRRSHAELRAASGDGCSSRCRYTRNSERRSAKPESQASRPRGSSHSVISFLKP